jgi:hypothetical protein
MALLRKDSKSGSRPNSSSQHPNKHATGAWYDILNHRDLPNASAQKKTDSAPKKTSLATQVETRPYDVISNVYYDPSREKREQEIETASAATKYWEQVRTGNAYNIVSNAPLPGAPQKRQPRPSASAPPSRNPITWK